MPDQPELSRRSFVTKASLGAVAVGALVSAGPLAGKASAAEKASPVHALPEPVVAHLTDLKSGQVHLYVGERGITITDHTLAQHLARAVSA
jgi:hypothetical protein